MFFPWGVGREWQVSAEEKAMVAGSHGGGAGPGGHAAWVLGVGDAICMVSADFTLLYPSSHPASSREWPAGRCSQICQVGRSCHPFLTLKGTKVETGPSLHTAGTWGAGLACSLSTRACSPAQPAQRPPFSLPLLPPPGAGWDLGFLCLNIFPKPRTNSSQTGWPTGCVQLVEGG